MEGRQQRKSFPLDLFSSSFDKQARAEVANAQEQLRLEKRQRHLDLLKFDAVKAHTAAQTNVRARSSNLLRGDRHATSPQAKKDDPAYLPALCRNRKISEGSAENGPRRNQGSRETKAAKAPVKLPFLTEKCSPVDSETDFVSTKSGVGESFWGESANSLFRSAGPRKKEKHKARDDFSVVADRPRVSVHGPSPGLGLDFDEAPTEFPRNSRRGGLRRRSLSANDISLKGRVNAFLDNLCLEGLQFSPDDSMTAGDVDCDEGDSRLYQSPRAVRADKAETVGLDMSSAYQRVFMNTRLEESGQPRYIRMPTPNRDRRTKDL